MKQFGNSPPPLSKRTPLSTNPPISEQIFHDSPLERGARGNCEDISAFVSHSRNTFSKKFVSSGETENGLS